MNILIWSSRKSVDHETNGRVKVHGDGTRADGRRSSHQARIGEIVGSRDGHAVQSSRSEFSILKYSHAGRMDRPTTEAPKTRIYFTTHRSEAFLVLRLRTVVRGERASRSIVNRTTALWSIWMVASLILADAGSGRYLDQRVVAKMTNREALTEYLK